MFNNKDKKYSKLLGIDEESYQIFIKRYVYFLRSQKQLNKKSVAAGFFILSEIQDEIFKKEIEKRIYKTKNIKILKYRDEIIELYQSGCGVVKVATSSNKIIIALSQKVRYKGLYKQIK